MQSDATGVACPNKKVKPCCLKFLFFFFFSEVGQGLFFWKSFWKSHSIYEWQVIISEPRGTNRTRPFSNSMIFFFHFSLHQQKWHQKHESKETASKQGNGMKTRKRHQSKETAFRHANSMKARKQHQVKELGNTPRKNWGIHIAAFLSRQPLVKGERLVRGEVSAAIPIVDSENL